MTKTETIGIWASIIMIIISAYLIINSQIKKAFSKGFETGCLWTVDKVDSTNHRRVVEHGTYIEYPSIYDREQFLRDKYNK